MSDTPTAFPGPDARMRGTIAAMIRARNIAVETLTGEQLAEALLQAIACGDFLRLVQGHGAQAVSYMPYRELQRLREQRDEARKEAELFRDLRDGGSGRWSPLPWEDTP